MKLSMILLLGMSAGIISSCQKDSEFLPEPDTISVNEEATLKSAKSENSGFVQGIMVDVDGDGEMYYFAGPPDGTNDVPGHYWVRAGKNRLVGKHFNTGPSGMASGWSSDAGDGTFLYQVDVIIDTWTKEKSEYYASRGYVHYHEFVSEKDGSLHPTKVPWLKHTAVTSFTFDRGPVLMHPEFLHTVTPGIDWDFPNNYMKPYNP